MRRIILVLLLCGLSWISNAQEGGVRAFVSDGKTSEPLEYVSVRVMDSKTNTLVKGAFTDGKGYFHIDGLAEGKYVLLVKSVGYDSLQIPFVISSQSPIVNFKHLKINQNQKVLGAVDVVSQRSQMSLEVDKKVFNVDQALTTAGSSASELLETIPSVEVDNEGSISLRGNTNVTIWIDGKPSGLTADNQGQILEQMPAENIEKIEVITNPSAKFSPEGSSGIINIVLKKDKRKGYYGSVQAGSSVDNDGHFGANLNANINYNSSKWDAYLNVGFRHGTFSRHERTDRTNLDANGDSVSFVNQSAHHVSPGNHLFARGGVTYHWTDRDQIGLDLMGNVGGRGGNNLNLYTSNVVGLYDTSWRYNNSDNSNYGGSVSLTYRHKFNSQSTLDLLGSFNRWNMDRDAFYQQTYNASFSSDTTVQEQKSNVFSNFWTLQADYSNQLSEKIKLEAGYKGEWQGEESPVSTFNGPRKSALTEDYSLYNDYFYDRNVQALYATFSHKISQFSYQLGLRGELTDVHTQSLAYGQTRSTAPTYDTTYFNFFPSLFLSYALPGNHEVQVNYTRRISRPRGDRLNPFVQLQDTMNISFGNPYLLPEYSNSLELNYLKNWNLHTISVSLYYRNTDNVIQRIRYRDGQVMKSTHVNVAHEQRTGLELISKNTLFKVLDLTTTLNFFYNVMDSFAYWPENNPSMAVTDPGSETFAWNARMMGSIMLPANFTLQLTGHYDAPRLVAQGRRMASFGFDAGLRKSFCNRKWSLNVNVRDLFNTQRWHTITEGAGFYQDYEGWRGRNVRISLTYSFGNMRAKPDMKRMENSSTGYEESEDM